MSLEKRIRDELHDTAERLALDPGEYRRAMELGAKRRRQRIGLILTSAVGLAAIVFAANAIEIGGTDEPGILAGNTAATIDPSHPIDPGAGATGLHRTSFNHAGSPRLRCQRGRCLAPKGSPFSTRARKRQS